MKKIKIQYVALLFSVLNLTLFHIPFFRVVTENVNADFNGVAITASLVLIMLAANYFAFYLLLYLGRIVGKILTSVIFIGNAISIYFINTYEVMLDDTMMGNVFNTNTTEATSYYSTAAILYVIFMGVLPAVCICLAKIDYGSVKRFFANIGVALGIILVVAFSNAPNWTWIDKQAPVIGSLLLPWSYIVNSIRYHNQLAERNREEILLPDATFSNDEKAVAVLVIGESARRDHFSLYGYERDTNPLLEKTEGVHHFNANSSATYTTAGVQAILEHAPTGKLYEVIPNYVHRCGGEAVWRSTNWGEPPLHFNNVQFDYSNREGCTVCGYDEELASGLKEEIESSGKSKVLIVLHTSTSHGPSYNLKYPSNFEIYSPVCTNVELSKCTHDELINAYDNTIVYTDYILSKVIEELKKLDSWKSCMLFVSDHGESLGEKNLYMHGVPLSIAPKEQYEIPFIVWSSENSRSVRNLPEATQHHVFHSVADFLDLDTPVLDHSMSIFEQKH
ncbi:MAG: phosphoethanolamine--lipid A transferase EptA [Paludibacteraceae bacterium]|nr:phosphoethanolamine--lipid A transferase EptA [Paludibacteraceae bacterium]